MPPIRKSSWYQTQSSPLKNNFFPNCIEKYHIVVTFSSHLKKLHSNLRFWQENLNLWIFFTHFTHKKHHKTTFRLMHIFFFLQNLATNKSFFHYLVCEDITDEKILQFTKNNVAIIGNKKSQQKMSSVCYQNLFRWLHTFTRKWAGKKFLKCLLAW